MEPVTERIARLESIRQDWERKSWEAAVIIGPFTTPQEHQASWDIRRAFARVTIELRAQQSDKETLLSTLIDRIKRETALTNWGLVLLLAEEFVEMENKQDESVAFVRGVVECIHADFSRPTSACWMPSFQMHRNWHLRLAEHLLEQLPQPNP